MNIPDIQHETILCAINIFIDAIYCKQLNLIQEYTMLTQVLCFMYGEILNMRCQFNPRRVNETIHVRYTSLNMLLISNYMFHEYCNIQQKINNTK